MQVTVVGRHTKIWRYFFDIGNTARNSVAISGGTDKFNYYVSYTNFNNQGTVHNTKLNKNNVLLNVGAQALTMTSKDFMASIRSIRTTSWISRICGIPWTTSFPACR